MRRVYRPLFLCLITVFGVWGCSRGPANSPGSSDRVKSLEEKSTRLEEDLRATSLSRDQYQRRLIAAESNLTQVRKELDVETIKVQILTKERDLLVIQMKQRTEERDWINSQFGGFRNNLRELLNQAEETLSLKPIPEVIPVLPTIVEPTISDNPPVAISGPTLP